MASSLARTLSSPFTSKTAQGVRKFMSLQASNAQKVLTADIQELFRERSATRKRKKIVNEIIESERSYQSHLQLLISNFLVPIKVGCLLSKAAIEAIFGNIEGICSVNLQLLELMETEDVASALYKLAPYMKLYSLYANNFELSNKTIEEQEKKNPDFLAFKESQESKEEMCGLKLRALLITPIQRIPRYKLLLDTLLEKTTPDHPDYRKLHDACMEVSKVATHINECLRLHENFNKMLSIQNSLVGDGAPRILAPGLYGNMGCRKMQMMVCERGGSKDRMFFLFNDILIYAKKETTCTYTCRGVFPLINCLIEQVMGGTRGPSEGGALFKIFCKGKTLLLYSTSKHNARSWVKDIKNAISELHTNLASLRRGETDPFTPPDAAFKRDSKLRRSKGAKDITKKNNTFSPIQQLSACVSPRQDILYPMRKDILPQLAENVNKPSLVSHENGPAMFASCLNSAKKDRKAKPRLRRLQLEDSFAKTPTSIAAGYDLRNRKRKCCDENVGKGDFKSSTARGSQRQKLIDQLNEMRKDNFSPGCFGSAKKPRKVEDEAYCRSETLENDGSFIETERDAHKVIEEANERKNDCDKADCGVSSVEIESKFAAGSAKVWSLTDDADTANGKSFMSSKFPAKSKVSRSRRKNRKLSGSHPYKKSARTSQNDNTAIGCNENTSLLCGAEGTFKLTNTSTLGHGVIHSKESDGKSSSCVMM
eukprot:Seg149.3 transcript_id=Seg149.3/GoldUCD/mRNA.D3Y31 product="Rho guanine nucleotide exchange factor 39" protein_id=Seg149.3/GoldUCD/D3Y31